MYLDVFDFQMNFCQHLTCPLSRRLQKGSDGKWKDYEKETGAKVTNGSFSDSLDKTGAYLTVQRLVVMMELPEHHR